ncbi:MAG: response regulator [Pseudomonas sp.]|nr:response regulator [Pseudomonas sp.]
MIASGVAMPLCLDALTEAVGRLAPSTRACVLLANEDASEMVQGYSSHFPPSFSDAIRGLPIGEALVGTCGTAIYEGRPVVCADVENSSEWAPGWRALCLSNGIRACYSHPALGPGGKAVASFFLCLGTARHPDVWEKRVAEFGALATGIVVERDRAAAHLRSEVTSLARLQELSAELVGPGEFEQLLKKILSAAADISGTDKGNIQIYDPAKRSLRIVVHQGLGARLVEHFLEDGWDASCGEAARNVQRLVVRDVRKLEHLRGTPGLEIVLEDQIRSIQCTPLLSRDGRLLGMLNNHYRHPGGPNPDALRYIDLLARQAAELIERHQRESELALERQRKDEFLAMLAHELRNPLAPMRNMLELQKRAQGDQDVLMNARNVIERQLLQLVRLVDDLLDVNRINQGRLELRLETLPLRDVVEQALEVSRLILEQRRQTIHMANFWPDMRVRGDMARLTQVFGNLLTNAAKYTPPGGEIQLRYRLEVESVEIVVQDNGSGIPKDQLDVIFEMFTQVDHTLERSQGGLGIGLMLVKRLVEMHGGTVRAESDGLNKGSAFFIRLPLANRQTCVKAPDVMPTAPPCRLLLADDNEDAAQSLAALLSMDGLDVRVAYSGAQVLQEGEQMRPDVVLLDICMPGMSGHEACRRMRQTEWGRHLPIIALTGLGQEHDLRETKDAGFDAHLIKPVDLGELTRLLVTLVKLSP